MAEEKKYEVLHKSPLGHELSEDECRTLLEVMHVRKLKDGEVFIEEGAKDNALHLLASGELMVTKKVVRGDSVNRGRRCLFPRAGCVRTPGGAASAPGLWSSTVRHSPAFLQRSPQQ